MAKERNLKLNLLTDTSKFNAGMKSAQTNVGGLDKSVQKATKAAAAAFAALAVSAGYAAIKIGKDSVDAAIKDQASQVKLAKALQNTTKANDAQIKSVEEYITKQQLSLGISDNQLRPAFANLARATEDLTKSQELTNLAVDISAATGSDLETVSLALGKAYNGNFGALTKLGIPLDENIKKTNLIRYGYDTPLNNPDIIKKSKETMIRKFGVDNISKVDYIKLERSDLMFINTSKYNKIILA
jgi:hypothetical protein